MGNIQTALDADLKEQLKFHKDKAIIDTLRVIKAEFQRERNKDVPDNKAVKIIAQLIKGQDEIIKHSSNFITVQEAKRFIRVAKELLPEEVSLSDVEAWIKVNIDFSKLGNKMQAIGIVKNHFGVTVDGNAVKELILDM